MLRLLERKRKAYALLSLRETIAKSPYDVPELDTYLLMLLTVHVPPEAVGRWRQQAQCTGFQYGRCSVAVQSTLSWQSPCKERLVEGVWACQNNLLQSRKCLRAFAVHRNHIDV